MHALPAKPAIFADRLEFTLADFTRLSWVGDHARDVWEPRLGRIMAAWREIEWLAVAEGVRPCCVTIDTPEQFLERAVQWAQHGLGALPVELTGLSGHTYSSTGVPYQPGQPFAFRFVVGRPPDVAAFQDAWHAGDQQAIGRLLGYPDCCREFFRTVWVDEGLVDTTWPMAIGTAETGGRERQREVRGPWQANILWRWMGARAVPHLPCRFDCPPTVALADQLLQVGRDAGYGEEMEWLAEVLSWPVQWSALHGIAEIKTPVLKVSTRTDATAGTYVVRYLGEGYPAEGAQGLDFPYRRSWRKPLTQSRGYLKGLDHALPVLQQAPDLPSPVEPTMHDPGAAAPVAVGPAATAPGTGPAATTGARGHGRTAAMPTPAPTKPETAVEVAAGPGTAALDGAASTGADSVAPSAAGLADGRPTATLAVATPPGAPAWYAADNGFATVAAMTAAHAPIVALVRPTLGERGGYVLDLGCGNGALLSQLSDICPGMTPVGVEQDATKVAHARELSPAATEQYVAGDLFETEAIWPAGRHYALALLMPGRLLEATPEQARRLRAKLHEQCDRVLVYAYGDWLERYGSLAGLAAVAGLCLEDDGQGNAAAALVSAG